MAEPVQNFHGSDLEQIEKYYGIRKEDIIRFGANVNPLGLSETFCRKMAQRLDVITSYPDRDYQKLREAIGCYCGADASFVLVGNGSTELLSLFIRLSRPGAALILGPTYSEYERELSLAGRTFTYFNLNETEDFILDENKLAERLSSEISLLILCNPNNPTSSAISIRQMEAVIKACRNYDILVMVDETYVEFSPDYEQTSSMPLTALYENLVVIRGVSKFFAAPGLRLGYAVTGSAVLLQHARKWQNPWSVSSLADTAGQLLFSDSEHIRKTKELIGGERQRMWEIFSSMDGIKVYRPQANFMLARIVKEGLSSTGLFEMAIRRGLMIRDCSSFFAPDHTYFRFCFMMPEDNQKLADCVEEYLR